MKITHQITLAYNQGHWIRAAEVLRKALQQAVAENLKMEFQNEHSDTQRGFPCIIDGNVCLDPRHDFVTWDHWLAEADKLLRGEK